MGSIYDNVIKATLRYYDNNATTFEEVGTGGEEGALRVFSQILKHMGTNPLIVDIGCGTGRLNRTLQSIGAYRYIGIDPSVGMLALAKKNYPDRDFRLGQLETLADVIHEKPNGFICMNVFVHIPPNFADRSLAMLRSMLSVGGIGFFMTYESSGVTKTEIRTIRGKKILYVKWNTEDLSSRIRKAGFEIIEPSFIDPGDGLPSSCITVRAL